MAGVTHVKLPLGTGLTQGIRSAKSTSSNESDTLQTVTNWETKAWRTCLDGAGQLREDLTMGIAHRPFSGRGLLCGTAAGAMLGVFLGLAMSERLTPASMTITDRVRGILMFAGIVAFLGGIAGGFLSREGWQMLAGAVVWAISIGLLGVVATLHFKGLIYSIFGGPLGAVAVYLFLLSRQSPTSTAEGRSPQRPAGVWDRELDR
jgi:hypothetical protein